MPIVLGPRATLGLAMFMSLSAPLEAAEAPKPANPLAPLVLPGPPAAKSSVSGMPVNPQSAVPGGAAPPLAIVPEPVLDPITVAAMQKDALASISTYFNGIRTMSGSFVQFAPDGQRSEGQFYLSKPGRIRFQYAKPSNIEVIADSVDVVVKDRRNQTQDLYPLWQTPLRYLLANQIDLTSEATVKKVSIEPDLISIVIDQSTVFGDGRLTLLFDRKTLELRQWTVTDAQGYDTAVAIYNTVINEALDPKLFYIDRTIIRK